ESSARTMPAILPCRRSAIGNRQRQCGELAYSAKADSSAAIAPAIVTSTPAGPRARLQRTCSPLEACRRGHRARVTVIAPVRRVAGAHVFLVGQVLHVQLRAPVAADIEV